MTEDLKKIGERYYAAMKAKGFSKDCQYICVYYAFSQEMHENYGSTEESLEKIIELLGTIETEDELIRLVDALASTKRAKP